VQSLPKITDHRRIAKQVKIEKIETFFVDRYLVVRITTDDGTQGIGESCYWS